ncbi:hypothetical protein FRC08_014378 [Ceratobasidium sp. 394]|nr:hypothetical protein FRC08_014378 [Ceratobasidium sp. 394]
MFKLGNVVRGHGYGETGGREAVTAYRYAATSRGEDLLTNKRPRLSYPEVALGSNTEDKAGFHESNRKPEPRAGANKSGEACTNCRRAQVRISALIDN